jgi:Acetyltransferase (GNAT) family
MIVDGRTVGCSAFLHDVDYDEQPRPKCLWIVSTGILPEIQGQGLGSMQKEWQIEYARQRGFELIVTNMRKSNTRIIRLNKKFGFMTRELVSGYYSDPEEAAVVMELKLQSWASASEYVSATRTADFESQRLPQVASIHHRRSPRNDSSAHGIANASAEHREASAVRTPRPHSTCRGRATYRSCLDQESHALL